MQARRWIVWRLLPWLVGAAILAAALSLWRLTSTHVTVIVNGQPVEVATHRRTVGGAVRLAGVALDEAVYIEPPAETPLQPGMVIAVGRLRPVIVHADGQTLLASTRQTDPQAIVAELGIALGPQDAVVIERALRPSPSEVAADPDLAGLPPLPREIRVARAQPILVHQIDSLTGAATDVSFVTTERSLGRALIAAGYALYAADRVSPPLETAVTGPLEVTLERATPVTLIADGQTRLTRTHQRTVGGLLAEMGLALSGEDYSLPSPAESLRPGLTVRLVRVRVEERVEQEAVPFGTLYVPDPDMALDQRREIAPGEPGVLERRIHARLEDGRVVSEAVVGEWISRQPQPRTVAYGTRITIRTLQTPYGPLQYWRVLRVLATSYSPSTAGDKQPGDPFFGLSATGAPVVRGIVATDPRVIPLGTPLYVPGYGMGHALDVGGAVKGFRIDLGYDDANLVLWNSWVSVYLLVPVPPPDEIIWVLPE